jgi:UrcA family protein
MLKTFALAAAAFALSAPSWGAETPSAATLATGSVNFHDPAAVAGFYGRLRAAASRVCDSFAANSRVTAADAACEEQAVARVVRSLDRPLLTALHEGQGASRLAAGDRNARAN